MAQFSVRPWQLSPKVVLEEMRTFAESPVFDELLYNLAYGEEQKSAPPGSIKHPLIIGWGRRDRVCFPSQANLALKKFPDAQLHWFDSCGHFPHWDKSQETLRLILNGMATSEITEMNGIGENNFGARTFSG